MIHRLFSLIFFSFFSLSCVGEGHRAVYSPFSGVAADAYYAATPAQLDFCGERVPLEFPDVKEALQRELSVTMYMHSSTLRTLRGMERYFAIIVPMLREAGIPEDFKYLAMAESGLNPEAISSARACGLWQIMSGTGKDYGLQINSDVDMRYNIEEATKVAIRYLKESYQRYGNWTMAAASYNLGPQGVSNRMAVQKIDDYYELFMPEETMRYVYRILALKIVSQDPPKYGFKLTELNYQRPFKNYTTIEVSDHHIDWVAIAKKHYTSYKMLRLLNPWIRTYKYHNTSHRRYTVKVPNTDFRIKGY